MPQSDKNEDEALLGRESLFRQKLNQLRNTGEIQRTIISSHYLGFKAIEQNHYLNNVSQSLQHTDPRQLESLALLDMHTELYNHNTLCRILKDELRRAMRYKNPLALLAIAIDNLHHSADETDSNACDVLLKVAAQFLMKAVRDVDIPARYDRDSFIIVCPETNLDGAISLSGRLCTGIEAEEFPVSGQRSKLTVSIGMATFPDLADGYEKLLYLAFQALKDARHSGGNTFKIVT
jgi:two-component system, cell cycle response regulator